MVLRVVRAEREQANEPEPANLRDGLRIGGVGRGHR